MPQLTHLCELKLFHQQQVTEFALYFYASIIKIFEKLFLFLWKYKNQLLTDNSHLCDSTLD